MEELLETHNFYKKLFKSFKGLPPQDMVSAINSATSNMLRNGDYESFRLFTARIKSYGERSKLSSERQAVVEEFLSSAEPLLIFFDDCPELRPVLRAEDWIALRCRFFSLLFGGSTANDALVWSMTNYCTMEELEEDAPSSNDEKVKISLKKVKEKLALLGSRGVGSMSPSDALAQQHNVNSHDLPIPVQRPVISLAESILAKDFTFEEADQLAQAIKLTDENGRYHLGGRKLGAVVGFCLALKNGGKLSGTIPEMTEVIGKRFGVVLKTRKATSSVATHYYQLTERELKRRKTTS